jgi:glycosyltransferase involved in cell wall biosynthesis
VLSALYTDGGIQRFNRTLLTACANLNIRCDVLSLGDSEAERSRWSSPASAQVAVYAHRKLAFSVATAARIALGSYDFIVVGHVNLVTLVARIARLFSRSRTIMIAHGIEVWTGVKGARRRALGLVDSILCVSRYTRQSIESQAPEIPHERYDIFPNALDENWRSQPSQDLEGELPERFLLAVTRLDRGERYKGIITVIETLPMLEDPSLHYLVAGGGNDIGFLNNVAERAGVRDRVHLIGPVNDAQLASLYRKCIAFVMPSGKEGFGIVFLEAMYFGACVIAAREKGAVDVVEHEKTGILVPYGDCISLKREIDRIVSDARLRQQLASAARATVLDDGVFTFRSFVRRLAEILGVPRERPPNFDAS